MKHCNVYCLQADWPLVHIERDTGEVVCAIGRLWIVRVIDITWSCSPSLSSICNSILGRGADNQNGNLRWFLPLGVDPPLNGTNFQTFFYPTFFLLQLNPTYKKRILHLVAVKESLLSPLLIDSKLTFISSSGR